MPVSTSTFQYKTSISLNRKNFLDSVVKNDDLNKKEIRVVLHLMTHLDAENYKEISKKNIAFDLRMSKSDVSEAIKNLIEFGLVEEGSSGSVKKGLKLLF